MQRNRKIILPTADAELKAAAFFGKMSNNLQRYSSTLSQGFKVEDLGNSPGWWAATIATYCQSRTSQLLAKTVTKHCDRLDE